MAKFVHCPRCNRPLNGIRTRIQFLDYEPIGNGIRTVRGSKSRTVCAPCARELWKVLP